MSCLDHIAACNAHDPDDYAPFTVGGHHVGWIRHALAAELSRSGRCFRATDGETALPESLGTVEARSQAIAEIGAELAARKLLPRGYGELCPVTAGFGGETLMHLDRAWLAPFGAISYGVHLNGHVDGPGGMEMWIGVRAADRNVAPGKLDNVVAGGLPVGLSLAENLIKEAAEEASIPAGLARRARPAGAVSYVMATEAGLRRDVLFVYDLALPADFEPANADGEISGFMRWPIERVLRTVDETDDFKFNVNLVLIDFAIRHGLIGPERADYLRLLRGLRAWG